MGPNVCSCKTVCLPVLLAINTYNIYLFINLHNLSSPRSGRKQLHSERRHCMPNGLTQIYTNLLNNIAIVFQDYCLFQYAQLQ